MQELLDKASAFTAIKETGGESSGGLMSPTKVQALSVSATE